MGVLKKILAGFISFTLILLLIILAVVISMNQLLHPGIYEKSLEKTDIDSFISQHTANVPMISLVVLPDGGIKGLFYEKLGNILAYLRHDTDSLDLRIKINTDVILSFYEERAAAVPVCVDDADFSWDNITCRPADMDVKDFLTVGLEKMNVTQTDYYDLKDFDKNNKIEEIRGKVRIYQVFFYSLIAVISLLMILLLLLFIGAPASFFIAAGVVGLFAGAASYGLSVILTKLAEETLSKINQTSALEILMPALREMVNIMMSRISLVGMMMILTGAVLLIVSFIFRRKDKKTKEK